MSFLKQDAFSLIYVKYRTFCKHCHLKNYQGALFGENDSRFSFESAHEFADKKCKLQEEQQQPPHRSLCLAHPGQPQGRGGRVTAVIRKRNGRPMNGRPWWAQKTCGGDLKSTLSLKRQLHQTKGVVYTPQREGFPNPLQASTPAPSDPKPQHHEEPQHVN